MRKTHKKRTANPIYVRPKQLRQEEYETPYERTLNP